MSEDDIAIGIVARIDYMKGYVIFSKVAKKILDNYKNIYFFSVGGGDENIKKECENILDDFNNKRFFWLGNQNSIEDIYSGFDISSSPSSFGEGFSNSIAEAMSCGVACVVSDVGDSKLIVADFGVVVEPNSADGLYNGLLDMMQKDYKMLGIKSQKRVMENFSVAKMVKNIQKEIYELA